MGMETFIVHVSDAGSFEARLQLKATPQSLGAAVGAALDQVLREQGATPRLPLFIDIQPAREAAGREWMYEREESRVPELALQA